MDERAGAYRLDAAPLAPADVDEGGRGLSPALRNLQHRSISEFIHRGGRHSAASGDTGGTPDTFQVLRQPSLQRGYTFAERVRARRLTAGSHVHHGLSLARRLERRESHLHGDRHRASDWTIQRSRVPTIESIMLSSPKRRVRSTPLHPRSPTVQPSPLAAPLAVSAPLSRESSPEVPFLGHSSVGTLSEPGDAAERMPANSHRSRRACLCCGSVTHARCPLCNHKHCHRGGYTRHQDDTDHTAGNCANRFHGVEDAYWWLSRQHFGETRSVFNVLVRPLLVVPARGWLRSRAVAVSDSRAFDSCILVAIALNAVTLAMDIPETKNNDSIQTMLSVTEIIFYVVFVSEFLMKVTAMGFVGHRFAYMNSAWNQLDFVVVVSATAGLYGAVGNYSVLRALRLLRPLRSVSRIPGLKTLMGSLIRSIPELVDVVTLLLFFMTLFAIVAVLIWNGTWHRRCYLTDPSVCNSSTPHLVMNSSRLCTTSPLGLPCDSDANGYTGGQSCEADTAVYEDTVLNFDNMGTALLLIFKIIALDGWTDDLHKAQDLSGHLAYVFFLLLTLLGAFFTMNLFLAILASVFSSEAEMRREEARRELTKTARTVTLYQVTPASMSAWPMRCAMAVASVDVSVTPKGFGAFVSACREAASAGDRIGRQTPLPVEDVEADDQTESRKSTPQSNDAGTRPASPRELLPHEPEMLSRSARVSHGGAVGVVSQALRCQDIAALPAATVVAALVVLHRPAAGFGELMTMITEKNEMVEQRRLAARGPFERVVDSGLFNNFIMFATVFNILVMCMVHHNMSTSWSCFINYSNWLCNVIFLGEMLLKWVGLGLKRYYSDNFNTFDCTLVMISVPSMLTAPSCANGGGSVSALRAFRIFRMARVLRVFRLVRRWKSLKDILVTIMQSLSASGYLMMIMLLFIYIYSILGIQMFAGKYPDEERMTFNGLWQTATTVFIIITGDSWNATMKVGMENSLAIAFLYFFSLFFIGNYIFINLFIAILVDNFARQSAEDEVEPLENVEDSESVVTPLENEQKNEECFIEGFESPDADDPVVQRAAVTFPGLESDSPRRLLQPRNLDMPPQPPLPPPSPQAPTLLADTSATSNNGMLFSPSPRGDSVRRERSEGSGSPAPSPHPGSLKKGNDLQSPRTSSKSLQKKTSAGVRSSSKRDGGSTVNDESTLSGGQVRVQLGRMKVGIEQFVFADFTDQESVAAEAQTTQSAVPELRGKSLKVLSPENPFRIAAATIVTSSCFKSAIFWIIVLNVGTMALDGPWVDNYDNLRRALTIMNLVFVLIFVLESTLHIVAFGLWGLSHEEQSQEGNDRGLRAQDAAESTGPYLRNRWNRVDCLVMVSGVIGLVAPAFRVIRSLRTVRLVIRNKAMRVVLAALFQAIPAIGNVVMVVFFIKLVFGILMIQFFAGKFWSCNDAAVDDAEGCVDTYQAESGSDVCGVVTTEEQPRQWVNAEFSFDSIFEATLTLFVIAMGDGWSSIMWNGVDARGESKSIAGPSARDSQPWMALPFILFVVCGSFFAFNIFTGLLIDTFCRMRADLDGSAFLSQEQAQFLRANKLMKQVRLREQPRWPDQKWGLRYSCLVIVHHWVFELVIVVCILLNVISMTTLHYGQSATLTSVQERVNMTFMIVFTFEAAIKLIALQLVYFHSGWNRFDFTLVNVSWIGFILEQFSLGSGASSLSVFRVLRVMRILRLIKRARGLKKMFDTLLVALPPLGNISLLLLIVYFNFAVLGVSVFGRVKRNDVLDEWLNFENVAHSAMTLYAISTTSSWGTVMQAVRQNAPGCTDDCGRDAALGYFPIFMVVCNLVTLNLVITIVLESFEEQKALEESREVFDELDEFRRKWEKMDPAATGLMRTQAFIRVLRNLRPPIGLNNPGDAVELMLHLQYLILPVNVDGELRYRDAIMAMLRKVFQISDDDIDALQEYDDSGAEGRQCVVTVAHFHAAMTIQRKWRAKKSGDTLAGGDLGALATAKRRASEAG